MTSSSYPNAGAVSSNVQIAFSKNNIQASARQAVERSIATLVARSVAARARVRDTEAELAKLMDSINAPFVKLLEADPGAVKALDGLRNRLLIVPDQTGALREHPSRGATNGVVTPFQRPHPRTTTNLSAIPPYDFSWSWHDGAPPFNQIIDAPSGHAGVDARSGAVGGGASGFVNAHAGFGIILRVDTESTAAALANLAPIRFSFTMATRGVGSSASSDGGAEVTVLEDGRLIASAPFQMYQRTVSGFDSASNSGVLNSADVPGQDNWLRFPMHPGREYTFNVGFWVFTDRTTGIGQAAVQGLVEGSAIQMNVSWFN